MAKSNSSFNVNVVSFKLEDLPARINVDLVIADKEFFTRINYNSIESWEEIWAAAPGLDRSLFLGTIVAWDVMRFMALGGETLTLCDGLKIDQHVAGLWRTCFLRQYGEWRYRNRLSYPAGAPRIWPVTDALSSVAGITSQRHPWERTSRVLLANGGGKDSLVGMLILQDAGLNFDVFEGVTPVGGALEVQWHLLDAFRRAVASQARCVRISVEDNFYVADDSIFEDMGIEVEHFRADFAVGATANYAGLFPLLIAHDYACAYFNIEASADTPDIDWRDEAISHQWCKSTEYRNLMADLFRRLTGHTSFLGFPSTISGLTDTTIYDVACAEPLKLAASHSCNLGKPWCGKCPKCCFAYLMMSTRLGEAFACRVMGLQGSLFSEPEAQRAWRDLLEPSRVAWECVPSHDECVMAVGKLSPGAELPEWMRNLGAATQDKDDARYRIVHWTRVPANLRRATLSCLGKASVEVWTPVVIVGGGQSGLSVSRVLQREGVSHAVLEAEDIGAVWRSRWDSFRLNTPNRTLHLPDFQYSGNDPDGFMSKEEVRQFLEDYVRKFDLPVIDHCAVTRVSAEGDGFLVQTALGALRAGAVVVATGEYVMPKLPNTLRGGGDDLPVVHSSNYRRPEDLPPGAVLVVGGGQSGAQIVEDLRDADRKVFWSLSDRASNVRRIFGKDFMEWWEIGGILHRHVQEIPDVKANVPGALRKARSMEFPLVSGVGGGGLGHSISLVDLQNSNITLLAKLEYVNNGIAFFSPHLNAQLARAQAGTRAEFAMLQDFANNHFGQIAKPDLDTHFVPAEVFENVQPKTNLTRLHLGTAGITSIVAATGYASAWPWLDIPSIFDCDGYPLGEDGVSPAPGLFFVGLFNLQRLSSTCLCNGGRDAETLAVAIKKHIALHNWSAAHAISGTEAC